MLLSRLKRCGVALLLLSVASSASAEKPVFGANDVATVFFINKSDDHNRVDYGLRLDAACRPVGKEALFPYWREFENAPPVRTHPLGWWEYTAYGVADQGPTDVPGEHHVKLKRLPRDLIVVIQKSAEGKCTAIAKAHVAGVAGAEVLSAFAKLRSVLGTVQYVEIHARDPRSGAMLSERLEN